MERAASLAALSLAWLGTALIGAAIVAGLGEWSFRVFEVIAGLFVLMHK